MSHLTSFVTIVFKYYCNLIYHLSSIFWGPQKFALSKCHNNRNEDHLLYKISSEKVSYLHDHMWSSISGFGIISNRRFSNFVLLHKFLSTSVLKIILLYWWTNGCQNSTPWLGDICGKVKVCSIQIFIRCNGFDSVDIAVRTWNHAKIVKNSFPRKEKCHKHLNFSIPY